MAEFNFGISRSLKYRCSFVGVTGEGAEIVNWKLHSVWKQVKTPEDLAVLLKVSPFWIQLNISLLQLVTLQAKTPRCSVESESSGTCSTTTHVIHETEVTEVYESRKY